MLTANVYTVTTSLYIYIYIPLEVQQYNNKQIPVPFVLKLTISEDIKSVVTTNLVLKSNTISAKHATINLIPLVLLFYLKKYAKGNLWCLDMVNKKLHRLQFVVQFNGPKWHFK